MRKPGFKTYNYLYKNNAVDCQNKYFNYKASFIKVPSVYANIANEIIY